MIHLVRCDDNHLYWVGLGFKIRAYGYSEIAKDLGITQENDFHTEQGRAEGVALHLWLKFLASGKTSTTEPDPAIAGRVEGIKKFIRDTKFKIVGGEEPRYDPINRFACTPDIWGHMGNWSWVLDAKRGGKMKSHPLQTGAQTIALGANGFRAQKRGALYLRDGDYRLIEHEDKSDIQKWCKFVEAFHLKPQYQEKQANGHEVPCRA